eukprot:403350325
MQISCKYERPLLGTMQDQFNKELNLLNDRIIDLDNGISRKSGELGQLIDSCEKSDDIIIGDHVILEYTKALYSFRNKIEDYEIDIQDLRKKWRKYLIDNDLSQQLQQDLLEMFMRIQQESVSHKTILTQIKQMMDSQQELFSLVLTDEQVKSDYYHNMECYQLYKEQLIGFDRQYQKLQVQFISTLEKVDSMVKSFTNIDDDNKTQSTKINRKQLEEIEEEAHGLIEKGRIFIQDLVQLHKDLTLRREKLSDVDIQNNLHLTREKFLQLFEEVKQNEIAVQSLCQAIDLKLISTFDSDTKQFIEVLKSECEEIGDKILDVFSILQQIMEHLNNAEQLIQRHSSEELITIDLKILIPYIQSIGELSSVINQQQEAIQEIEIEIETKKLLLGEEDLAASVQHHSQQTLQQRESLNELKSEIRTMMGLMDDLHDYATDEDDQKQIILIKKSLDQIKQQLQTVDQDCQKSEMDVETLISEVQDIEDQTSRFEIIDKVTEIDRVLTSNERQILSIKDLVKRKSHRFSDFDLKSKLLKRMRQVDQCRQLQEKSKKSIQKLNQHIGSDVENIDDATLAQFKLMLKQYHETHEKFSLVLANIDSTITDKIQPYIPKDPLSMNSSEQNKLLQRQSDLRLKLNDLKQKFCDLKQHLKSLKLQTLKAQQNQGTQEKSVMYNALPGDKIDFIISEYVNRSALQKPIPVRIQRLDQGIYQFGTKKITMRFIDETLMVKLGGGYIALDDFIQTYAERELKKLIIRENDELESLSQYSGPIDSRIKSFRTASIRSGNSK